MKPKTFLLAASCFALGAVSVAAQASPRKSAESPEIEYLRRLIAEQQKNPGKVLRSLPASNAPAAKPPAAPPSTATATTTPSASSPAGVAPSPPSAEAARQQKISEVEARLDEMLRQKEAREKAARTNAAAPTNSIGGTPQTRRQRLDTVLKQMIDGQITGAEYNEKREKILAEPD